MILCSYRSILMMRLRRIPSPNNSCNISFSPHTESALCSIFPPHKSNRRPGPRALDDRQPPSPQHLTTRIGCGKQPETGAPPRAGPRRGDGEPGRRFFEPRRNRCVSRDREEDPTRPPQGDCIGLETGLGLGDGPGRKRMRKIWATVMKFQKEGTSYQRPIAVMAKFSSS